jgi:hypothetical protein
MEIFERIFNGLRASISSPSQDFTVLSENLGTISPLEIVRSRASHDSGSGISEQHSEVPLPTTRDQPLEVRRDEEYLGERPNDEVDVTSLQDGNGAPLTILEEVCLQTGFPTSTSFDWIDYCAGFESVDPIEEQICFS